MTQKHRSMCKFYIYAYDNPELPLGRKFYNNLHAGKCWDEAKVLALEYFKKAIEDSSENSHVIGKCIWIYRYEFQYPVGLIGFTEALSRTLSGDFTDQVEDLELCCVWFERTVSGGKFYCESTKGQNDENPRRTQMNKYGGEKKSKGLYGKNNA